MEGSVSTADMDFNPAGFLWEVHRLTSFDELQQGLKRLQRRTGGHNELIKELVKVRLMFFPTPEAKILSIGNGCLVVSTDCSPVFDFLFRRIISISSSSAKPRSIEFLSSLGSAQTQVSSQSRDPRNHQRGMEGEEDLPSWRKSHFPKKLLHTSR